MNTNINTDTILETKYLSIIQSINTEIQEKSITVSLLSMENNPEGIEFMCIDNNNNAVEIKDFKHIREISKLRIQFVPFFDLVKILSHMINKPLKKIQLHEINLCDSVLVVFLDLIRQNKFIESVIISNCYSNDNISFSDAVSEISRNPKISDFVLIYNNICGGKNNCDFIQELTINHNVKELYLMCLGVADTGLPEIIQYVSDDNVLECLKIKYPYPKNNNHVKNLLDVLSQKSSIKILDLTTKCDINDICEFLETLNQKQSLCFHDVRLTYDTPTKNINFERLINLLRDNYAVKSLRYIYDQKCPNEIEEFIIRNNNLDQEKKFKYTKCVNF